MRNPTPSMAAHLPSFPFLVLLASIASALGFNDFHGLQKLNVSSPLSEKLRVLSPLADLHSSFMSNMELEKSMKSFAKKCNSIARLYSIGKSSLGFPLWVLEISDKPGEIEAEPAFKYIGNLHGDEPVGRELLLLLANWLCDNYLKDPLATLIVKDIHLHLLPTMNPDGYKLKSRNNANDVDLNRDFPDQFFQQNKDEALRQPETIAVMKWIRSNNFVASASLHGGAVVANYPWDGNSDGRTRYSMCDDDSTFRYLAKIYSQSHAGMSSSDEFPGGITNGAAWYPLYGGMQDWNYIHGNCMELTLEISRTKWPIYTELEGIWEQNRVSMLLLVASIAKCGIHGRILSSSSGQPLPGSISVKGSNFTVKAGRKFGDYHRLLSPGNDYEVTATMSGHRSQTLRVQMQEGKATHLDFILEPLASEQKDRSYSEPNALTLDHVNLRESDSSKLLEKSVDEAMLSHEQDETDGANDEDESFANNSTFIQEVTGIKREHSILSKENLRKDFVSSRKQLRTAPDGDVIAELIFSHFRILSFCLMSTVVFAFIFFFRKRRSMPKFQKARQLNKL